MILGRAIEQVSAGGGGGGGGEGGDRWHQQLVSGA